MVMLEQGGVVRNGRDWREISSGYVNSERHEERRVGSYVGKIGVHV